MGQLRRLLGPLDLPFPKDSSRRVSIFMFSVTRSELDIVWYLTDDNDNKIGEERGTQTVEVLSHVGEVQGI